MARRIDTSVVEGPLGLKMQADTARRIEEAQKKLPKDFTYRRVASVGKNFEFGELPDGSRTEISMVTTDAVDRDNEVVLPQGIDLSEFLTNPVVCYAHRYDMPPIGRALWIKPKDNGLAAKTQYAKRPDGEAHWMPDVVFSLIQQNMCVGKSIGFLPMSMRGPTKDELNRRPELKTVNAVIDKSLMLEYSSCALQSNAPSLVMAVSKALKAGTMNDRIANLLTSTMKLTVTDPNEPMPSCYKCGNNEKMVSLRSIPGKQQYRCEKCGTEYAARTEIGPLQITGEEPVVINGSHLTVGEMCKSIKTKRKSDTIAPLAPTYAQYTEDANGFEPERNIKLSPELAGDAYRVEPTPWGVRFAKMRPQTDELYHFKDSTTEQVLSEIDKFWDLKADYDKLGLMHNRGIILHGPPGTGKTSALHQAAEMVVDRGDVVFYAKSIRVLIGALSAFREIEPDRKVVVVLEDADEFVGYAEREFLQLLDGEQSISGILYLATTNYIKNFPPRLLRSGRFDKKIYVGPPPYDGRLAYLKHKLDGVEKSQSEIERLAKETDGLSFGDLREIVTAVYALKEPVGEVLSRLTGKSIVAMKAYMQKSMKDMTDGNAGAVVPDDDMPECPKCMNSANVSKKDDGGMYTCSMCSHDFMHLPDGGIASTTCAADDPYAKSVKSLELNGGCVKRAKVLIAEGKVNHGEWSAPVGSERSADDCLAVDPSASDAAKYKYPIIKGGELYSKGAGAAAGRAEDNGAANVAAAAHSLSKLIEAHGDKKYLEQPAMTGDSRANSIRLETERQKKFVEDAGRQASEDAITLANGG